MRFVLPLDNNIRLEEMARTEVLHAEPARQ